MIMTLYFCVHENPYKTLLIIIIMCINYCYYYFLSWFIVYIAFYYEVKDLYDFYIYIKEQIKLYMCTCRNKNYKSKKPN